MLRLVFATVRTRLYHLWVQSLDDFLLRCEWRVERTPKWESGP
jgi:hypothetical protein